MRRVSEVFPGRKAVVAHRTTSEEWPGQGSSLLHSTARATLKSGTRAGVGAAGRPLKSLTGLTWARERPEGQAWDQSGHQSSSRAALTPAAPSPVCPDCGRGDGTCGHEESASAAPSRMHVAWKGLMWWWRTQRPQLELRETRVHI